jgi:sugar O-acyltransferase (sialic acid O-acetyltransferase NeuD family)
VQINTKRMVILGAGGFAKELLEVVLQFDEEGKKEGSIRFMYQELVHNLHFFDTLLKDSPDSVLSKYPILTTNEALAEYLAKHAGFFALGIGSVPLRKKLYDLGTSLGGNAQTIISPFARIGRNEVVIGEGCTLMTGSVLTASIHIGKGCLINLNCTVGHDTQIGDFCELSPGTHISGGVEIGDFCTFGTGSVVLPKIKIGNYVTVGAGAVVTKDVPDNTTVVGIPAKSLLR